MNSKISDIDFTEKYFSDKPTDSPPDQNNEQSEITAVEEKRPSDEDYYQKLDKKLDAILTYLNRQTSDMHSLVNHIKGKL